MEDKEHNKLVRWGFISFCSLHSWRPPTEDKLMCLADHIDGHSMRTMKKKNRANAYAAIKKKINKQIFSPSNHLAAYTLQIDEANKSKSLVTICNCDEFVKVNRRQRVAATNSSISVIARANDVRVFEEASETKSHCSLYLSIGQWPTSVGGHSARDEKPQPRIVRGSVVGQHVNTARTSLLHLTPDFAMKLIFVIVYPTDREVYILQIIANHVTLNAFCRMLHIHHTTYTYTYTMCAALIYLI